jgi:hypothetical protein
VVLNRSVVDDLGEMSTQIVWGRSFSEACNAMVFTGLGKVTILLKQTPDHGGVSVAGR